MEEKLKFINLTEEINNSNDKPPTVTATVVHDEGCKYRFTITAQKHSSANKDDVKEGTATFTIPDGIIPEGMIPKFSDFHEEYNNGSPVNYNLNPKIWVFDTLDGKVKDTKTLVFTAIYTGPTTSFIPLIDGTFTGKFVGSPSNSFNGRITVAELTPDHACQPTPPTDSPCCEDCDISPAPIISICPCENKVFTESIIATPKPSGRILSVNLSLINACGTKDVNVAVFLNELIPVPGGEPIEVPYAFKVIRMPALPCEGSACCACETRTCHCVEFEINDDDTTKCITRNFRIRTKATTILSGDEPTCPCECQGD